ncbi:hypothetical protein [Streptomyces sp. NRRL S-378]|uniref:hypothetical protein n=1 Tax=Streptomyces sp. NRRL S-378 TaxID=1463904 RepID=UPI000AA5FC22|nr:hypothetical protein [Streptomyces sp. NRRL S-378]
MFTTTQDRPIDPTNLTRTFTTLLRKAVLCRTSASPTSGAATLLLKQASNSS